MPVETFSHSSATRTAAHFQDELNQRLPDKPQLDVCLQCGACSGVCPFGFRMAFPPGRMIAYLRADLFDRVMNSDSPWLCVACCACTEVCPSKIPIADGMMTRAKEELLLLGSVPAELQEALTHSQRYGNPLGESPRKRAAWTKGLPFEVPVLKTTGKHVENLWFVGDYGSYHPRAQKATRALARILNTLAVDFAILGPEENSDGDSQRLAGERGLFELLAEKNGRTLAKYSFDRIITADPHAFNALKNEYPTLGIQYPVQHYTEFLAERLHLLLPHFQSTLNTSVTYHDPCYLGRANRIFDAPRKLLTAIPGVELLEMAHNQETSLCCGGGGGGMWLDGFQWERTQVRMSTWRVQEAAAVQADVLAVACPYEAPRFEDASPHVPGAEGLRVRDIAELIDEAMSSSEGGEG